MFWILIGAIILVGLIVAASAIASASPEAIYKGLKRLGLALAFVAIVILFTWLIVTGRLIPAIGALFAGILLLRKWFGMVSLAVMVGRWLQRLRRRDDDTPKS